jgi:hypothetical protein
MAMLAIKFLLLTISVWLAGLATANEANVINREYQLKTAYLFHFAELTTWPAPGPVTICLQGQNPLRNYMPALEGQQINGKAVHLDLDDKPDINRCSILVLSDIASLTPSLQDQAKTQHILLVGDVDNFADNGGMVQFTLRDNKLKLMVNLATVKSADLKLSSKLLRMAEIIE